MALNFRLFNCDRTFSLDKVEALIQRVAAKISREVNIEKTYFPLPRMKELCEELEKEGSHFEYAVFVVHAHESRLSINERNAGIGYARVYRALQKATDDRVLIVIGGDDNYKHQGERDKSILSRWVWLKICSQFTEDYVNGVKSFIFSWEENHHPIHEEALEFYLDLKKKGNQFVPRPKPPPAKVHEKDETKNIEQAKFLELKRQELQAADTRKRLEKEQLGHEPLLPELRKEEPQPREKKKTFLEKEFPPGKNEGRPFPSLSEMTSTKGMADPLQEENHKMEGTQVGQYQAKQASASTTASSISGTPNVHILSFHASKSSVDGVVDVFERVYKELAIASKPKSSTDLQINIQDYIMKYKPEYLVLVSDFEDIEDMLNLDKQVQHYQEIVKMSTSAGSKLIFIIPGDKDYREGYLSSVAVHDIFTKLNRSISSLDQLMVMSWNKTPWPTHEDALTQLLTPYGKVQRAAPHQYGATKQVAYTQPEDVPMTRRSYRACISYGRVVEVLMSDPPGWKPDASDLDDLLMKHRSEKKATIEFWDEGDGLQGVVHPSKAKLYKIAEGFATDEMHSILVYSYHLEEKTNGDVSNFIHHLGVSVLLPYQPIEPASLMTDVMSSSPDYVMVSADADELKDEGEVKKVVREQGAKIRKVIENCVGKGVIIMLFGDKYYKPGEFASKEATQHVRMLTQEIVTPDRLTVMTCKERPYTTHQNWMKELLNSKEKKPSTSQGAVPSVPSRQHCYKAVIRSGQITEVLERIPTDWIPDEGLVRKILEENKQERKAYLEIVGNEQGEILSIIVEKESKVAYYVKKYMPKAPKAPSWFSWRSDNSNSKNSNEGYYG